MSRWTDVIEALSECELSEADAIKLREAMVSFELGDPEAHGVMRGRARALWDALEESIFFSLRCTSHDPEHVSELMDQEYGPEHVIVPATHECYP